MSDSIVGGEFSPLELHREVVDGWPAMEVSRLGDWFLRASGGFTARGNSVLPVGDPGLSLERAIAHVEGWYAARALPSNVTIPVPAQGDPLGRMLLQRGYAASDPSLFLTATTAAVCRTLGPNDDLAVTISPELTEEWLVAYDGYRVGDRTAARAIMTGSPAQRFATARADGAIIGVGRLGVSEDWGGIAAMWVDPAYRRKGVAQTMLAELASCAGKLGASNLHLQVWAHNTPAVELYRRARFHRHHVYANLTLSRR